jgi:hypothetical protein
MNSSGVSPLTVTLTAGTHSIVAHYDGDATHEPSDSTVLSQGVVASCTSKGTVSNGETKTGTLNANTPCTISPVPPSGTGTATYYDFYNFTGGVAGQVLSVRETPTSGGFYAYAYILNSKDGKDEVVASSNGSGSTSGVTVSYTLPADTNGNYKIRASTWDGTGQTSYPYTGNYSLALTVTTPKANTTAALTSSTIQADNIHSNSIYGASVTFTATVAGGVTPTGDVVFKDGTIPIATVALASGSASYSTTTLGVLTSPHRITASYAGDSTHNASVSSEVVHVTTVKSITISGITAANKVYDGNTTAALSGGTLNGVLAVDQGKVSLGNLIGAFADSTVGANKPVTVTFTLTGSAASNYTVDGPSSVNSVTANITAKALTITGITAANKIYDSNTTATLSGGTLSGIVGTDNVTFSATGAFANADVGTGKAVTVTVTLGGTSASNYTITNPTGVTANITKAASTVSLTSSANPHTIGGSALTLTATVTATAGGAPTGTITFKEGTTNLGTGTLNASGVATLAISTLSAGSHSIVASYGGDAAHESGVSSAVNQVVKYSSSVSVSSSPNPSYKDQSVTITVSVTTGIGGATPSGKITLKDGGVALSVGDLTTGGLIYTTSGFTIGSHSLVAEYGGDSTHMSSISPALPHTVNPIGVATITPTLPSVGSTFPSQGANKKMIGWWSISADNTGDVLFENFKFSVATTTSGNNVYVTNLRGRATRYNASTSKWEVVPGFTDSNFYVTNNISGVANGTDMMVAFNNATGKLVIPKGATYQFGVEGDITTVANGILGPITTKIFGDNPEVIHVLPASLSLVADKTAIGIGESINLSWSPSDVSSCTASSNPIDDSWLGNKSIFAGSVIIFPAQDTTYTLTCVGFDGVSQSKSVDITVSKAASDTTVSSSANPSNESQSLTLTATVTATAGGMPTGNVIFKEGNIPLENGTVALDSGVATFTTSTLFVGTHNIVASYTGDDNHTGSVSMPLVQVINPAPEVSLSVVKITTSNPLNNTFAAGQRILGKYKITASDGIGEISSLRFKLQGASFPAVGTSLSVDQVQLVIDPTSDAGSNRSDWSGGGISGSLNYPIDPILDTNDELVVDFDGNQTGVNTLRVPSGATGVTVIFLARVGFAGEPDSAELILGLTGADKVLEGVANLQDNILTFDAIRGDLSASSIVLSSAEKVLQLGGSLPLVKFRLDATGADAVLRSLDIHVSPTLLESQTASLSVSNLKLFAYTDASMTIPVDRFSLGQLNTPLAIGDNGITTITPDNVSGETEKYLLIPGDSSLYFVLRGDVSLTGADITEVSAMITSTVVSGNVNIAGLPLAPEQITIQPAVLSLNQIELPLAEKEISGSIVDKAVYTWAATASGGSSHLSSFKFDVNTEALPVGVSLDVTNMKVLAYTDPAMTQPVQSGPQSFVSVVKQTLFKAASSPIVGVADVASDVTIPVGQTYYFKATSDINLSGDVLSGLAVFKLTDTTIDAGSKLGLEDMVPESIVKPAPALGVLKIQSQVSPSAAEKNIVSGNNVNRVLYRVSLTSDGGYSDLSEMTFHIAAVSSPSYATININNLRLLAAKSGGSYSQVGDSIASPIPSGSGDIVIPFTKLAGGALRINKDEVYTFDLLADVGLHSDSIEATIDTFLNNSKPVAVGDLTTETIERVVPEGSLSVSVIPIPVAGSKVNSPGANGQTLYRFSVSAANGYGSISSLSLRSSVSFAPTSKRSMQVKNVKMYVYSAYDPSKVAASPFSTPIEILKNSAGQMNQTVLTTTSDVVYDTTVNNSLALYNRIIIPEGITYYFELKADVSMTGGIFTARTVATKLIDADAILDGLSSIPLLYWGNVPANVSPALTVVQKTSSLATAPSGTMSKSSPSMTSVLPDPSTITTEGDNPVSVSVDVKNSGSAVATNVKVDMSFKTCKADGSGLGSVSVADIPVGGIVAHTRNITLCPEPGVNEILVTASYQLPGKDRVDSTTKLYVTVVAPVVSPLTISDLVVDPLDSDTAVITWNTNRETNAVVLYSKVGDAPSMRALYHTPPLGLPHKAVLDNLVGGEKFHFTIRAIDLDGDSVEYGPSEITTPADVETSPEDYALTEHPCGLETGTASGNDWFLGLQKFADEFSALPLVVKNIGVSNITAEVENKTITINEEPGALSSDVILSLGFYMDATKTRALIKQGFKLVGDVGFSAKTFDKETGQPLPKPVYTKPMNITITFKGSDCEGLNFDRFGLHIFNEFKGVWEPIPMVDMGGGYQEIQKIPSGAIVKLHMKIIYGTYAILVREPGPLSSAKEWYNNQVANALSAMENLLK